MGRDLPWFAAKPVSGRCSGRLLRAAFLAGSPSGGGPASGNSPTSATRAPPLPPCSDGYERLPAEPAREELPAALRGTVATIGGGQPSTAAAGRAERRETDAEAAALELEQYHEECEKVLQAAPYLCT